MTGRSHIEPMTSHPLLAELLQICSNHNIETSKAHVTFNVFLELSEVRKLFNLQYFFNDKLKLFYLSGKKSSTDEPEIYIPVTFDTEITPQDITSIQTHICQDMKQFYLVLKGEDSSSTCYMIKEGLEKPLSPEVYKLKKELEDKKYHYEKKLMSSRKILYSKCIESQNPTSS